MNPRAPLVLLLASLVAGACREKAPPAGAIVFQLSAVHPTAADSVGPPFVATDSLAAQGPDTILVQRARIVLAELAIAPAVSNECDEEEGEDNPPCVEFSDEPVAIDLPLGRTVRRAAKRAPATDYNLFQAAVHPVDSTGDRELVDGAPEMANASVRVEGTYSHGGVRHPFTYTTAWSEQQEITIEPALTVTAGDSLHVTLRVDVASWFRNAGRTGLIDPVTALRGGPNENLVKDNVRLSFKVLRDRNADGLEDSAVR